MTRKEAVIIPRDFMDLGMEPGEHEAFILAISALNPWNKLSEKKPRKEGLYWIYTPIYGKDSDLSIRKAWWNGRLHGFRIAKQGVHSTHWAEIHGPEEE